MRKYREVTLRTIAGISAGAFLAASLSAAPWDRRSYECENEDSAETLFLETSQSFGEKLFRYSSRKGEGAFLKLSKQPETIEANNKIPDGDYLRRDKVVNLLFAISRDDTLIETALFEQADSGRMVVGAIQTMAYSEIYSLIRYESYYCVKI